MDAYRFVDGYFRTLSADDALQELANSIEAGRVVPLLGAGVSDNWPAGLPLAKDFTSAIHAALTSALPDYGARIAAALAEEPLEHLLDQMGQLSFGRSLDVLDVLDPGRLRMEPTISHVLIGRLATYGTCVFLTCNFDVLLEMALADAGLSAVVPESQDDEARAYRHLTPTEKRPVVLKLNGTITHRDSLFTTIELAGAGLPAYKVVALQRLLIGCDILFAGYSDNDTDIFPAVTSARSNKTFWYEHPSQFERMRTSSAASAIREYLGSRGNTVFIGELPEVLSGAFEIIGRSTTAMPANIVTLTTSLRADRVAKLSEIARRLAADCFDRNSAALLFARAVGANNRELSDELFTLVAPSNLPHVQRIAYWNEAAERKDKVTQPSLQERLELWMTLRVAPLARAEYERLLVEHALKLSWELDDAGGLCCRGKSWLLKGSVVGRLLTGRLQDRYARGTAISIMLARIARVPASLARLLLFRSAVARAGGKRTRSEALRFVSRVAALLSCGFYSVGRRVAYQQQGWLRIHRQTGGVMQIGRAHV